jgi:pyruvate/2-oxoglutarate dehydrogenase complex dihydrolipoamide dehydrogenase (E3) component
MNADAQITLVMSEQAPLEIFGWRAAEMMRAELEHANVHLELDASVGTVEGSSGELVLGPSSRRLTANGVLALPGLRGRTPHGIPQDAEGFVDADGLGRVRGIEGVWAAGGWHRLPSEVRRPRRPAGRRGPSDCRRRGRRTRRAHAVPPGAAWPAPHARQQ